MSPPCRDIFNWCVGGKAVDDPAVCRNTFDDPAIGGTVVDDPVIVGTVVDDSALVERLLMIRR